MDSKRIDEYMGEYHFKVKKAKRIELDKRKNLVYEIEANICKRTHVTRSRCRSKNGRNFCRTTHTHEKSVNILFRMTEHTGKIVILTMDNKTELSKNTILKMLKIWCVDWGEIEYYI